MFRRLTLRRRREKHLLTVRVIAVDGLPGDVAACRVMWARDAKVQMTQLATVEAGERRNAK
jgi:hypothetical protein